MLQTSFPDAVETAETTEPLSREQLERHHQFLRKIVAGAGRDADAQVRHALARATDLLGVDRGLLVRLRKDTGVVEQRYDPDGALEAGHILDLDGADCAAAFAREGVLTIDDVSALDSGARRCYEALALESYIGAPVHRGEELYGALVFTGAAPQRPAFTGADRSLVRLLGEWVGSLLKRRLTERSRRQAEEWLRLLAENVSDMVCLHDLDGHCIYVSPSVERLLGYAPEEVMALSPYKLAHPDDHERIRAAAGRALRGEADVVERSRLRCKDGSYRWCETAGHPVYAADGETVQHFLTSTRDITERVQAEEETQRTNAELRLRNRELKNFAHIASHDLQEPLRKVRAFADLMREDYDEEVDETGRYYLERMQDGAVRMSRLVSDLLSLSRITTKGHPFKPVDVGEIAAVVRTDLEMRIEETGGRVEIGEMPRLEADPTQLRQLLQNLVGNALKFHREGVPPVVEVRGACETTAEDDEHADQLAPGVTEVCRLVVADNGVGFEEKFLDRIFTPLQRLHNRSEYEGTGIGLAVCRRIVERHGGAIWAESAPGAGSRFIVLLPATQPRPCDSEIPASEPSTSEPPASGRPAFEALETAL